MKKVLISATLLIGMMASAVVFSSFTTPKEDTETTCVAVSPEPSCKTVGNCSVNLVYVSQGVYTVRAQNHNDYGVNVSWSAIGYDDSGRQRQVASGTLYCTGSGDGKVQLSSRFQTGCKDVGLGSVNVSKCD